LDRLQTVWPKVDAKDMPKDYARIEDLVQRLEEHKAETPMAIDAVHQEWAAAPYKAPPAATLHLEVLQKSQKDMQSIFYVRSVQRFFELVNSIRSSVTPVSNHKALEGKKLTTFGISLEHLRELSDWVDRSSRSPADGRKTLRMLLAFGCAEAAMSEFERLMDLYEVRREGKKPIIKQLRQLRCADEGSAYSYALLSTFSFLWTRHIGMNIWPLPLHFVVHQIEAIRKRFGLNLTDPIPSAATELLVCCTCDATYSIICDAESPVDAQGSFGFSSVPLALTCISHLSFRASILHEFDTDKRIVLSCFTVVFVSGDVYCSRSHVQSHRDFAKVKLSRIQLLGAIFQFRRRLFLLCGNCSIPCVLEPAAMLYTQKGFICAFCSRAAMGLPIINKRRGRAKG
jgi:hypothetical protein